MKPFSICPAVKALWLGLMLAGATVAATAQSYAPPPPDYPPPYPARDYPAPEDRAPEYRYDEDITVYGRHRRVPDDVEALSQRVSYADLDLYYAEDRRELRRRIADTARYLCDRLGESDDSGSVVPSCRDAAVRDALRQVGAIEARWGRRAWR